MELRVSQRKKINHAQQSFAFVQRAVSRSSRYLLAFISFTGSFKMSVCNVWLQSGMKQYHFYPDCDKKTPVTLDNKPRSSMTNSFILILAELKDVKQRYPICDAIK